MKARGLRRYARDNKGRVAAPIQADSSRVALNPPFRKEHLAAAAEAEADLAAIAALKGRSSTAIRSFDHTKLSAFDSLRSLKSRSQFDSPRSARIRSGQAFDCARSFASERSRSAQDDK